MTLHAKQSLFSLLLAKLLIQADRMGFEVTMGECYRSPEEAARQAALGRGIKNSLHTQRLAVDINLFRDFLYLDKSEQYQALGEWWERQHELCRWGGRFKNRPDGNHFSLEHEGRQ